MWEQRAERVIRQEVKPVALGSTAQDNLLEAPVKDTSQKQEEEVLPADKTPTYGMPHKPCRHARAFKGATDWKRSGWDNTNRTVVRTYTGPSTSTSTLCSTAKAYNCLSKYAAALTWKLAVVSCFTAFYTSSALPAINTCLEKLRATTGCSTTCPLCCATHTK